MLNHKAFGEFIADIDSIVQRGYISAWMLIYAFKIGII